jgi:fibronectin-binding autotransporter adhesin
VTYGGLVSGSGSLAQSGSGTLILTDANTYSGGTFLNAGTIAVAFDHALGDPNGGLTFNGGTLQFNAQFDLSTTRPITLQSSGGTINTQSFSTTINQAITGPGGLTKAGTGTLALTADNIYTGGTSINGGTLQLGNGGTTGSITGNVTDNGTLVFNRSGDKKTFDGVISGTGSMVKLGSDILELTAVNTYSGRTFIQDGVLVAGIPQGSTQETSFALGTGDVFLQGGTLRTPSLDPLTINVGGNYAQGSGGTLALGVAGLNVERL